MNERTINIHYDSFLQIFLLKCSCEMFNVVRFCGVKTRYKEGNTKFLCYQLSDITCWRFWSEEMI